MNKIGAAIFLFMFAIVMALALIACQSFFLS
jgi:hypothetical protein